MLNRTTKTRLHIRSISNAPAELDHEIGELFREMRQATGQPLEEIAAQLKTKSETIRLLEQGHLSAMPPWSETNRVIVEYTNMLGLDPDPVLRRIMLQLPADHPARPKTQIHEPSYDNMRANAEAILNRVPRSQTALEHNSLSMQPETPGHQPYETGPVSAPFTNSRSSASAASPKPSVVAEQSPPPEFSPPYGEMRAIPHELASSGTKSETRVVAKKRKSGVFVPLVQFLLLLIILGAGYVMWLAVNDPQGFEDLKSLVMTGWDVLLERMRSLSSS